MRPPECVLDFHVHPVEVHDQPEWSRRLYERTAPEIAARIAEFEDPMVLRRHLVAAGVHEAVIIAEVLPDACGLVGNDRICAYAERGNQIADDTLADHTLDTPADHTLADRTPDAPTGARPWLHPFVSLNPSVHVDVLAEFDSLRSKWRVAGVKLAPPYGDFHPADRRLYPLYARLEELSLPVMFHTGSSVFRGSRLKYADPLLIDDVAVDHPGLRIVLAHSGRGVWYAQAALMAKIHEHVYLEVSGLPPRRLREYFPTLDRLAPKVIFGSDWPVLPDLAENVTVVAQVFGERAADVLYATGRSLLPD